MENIQLVSEAYSTQPISCIVSTEQVYKHAPEELKPIMCKEIKLERLTICNNEWVFVCYNFDGLKIAQFLANSVNVQFIR